MRCLLFAFLVACSSGQISAPLPEEQSPGAPAETLVALSWEAGHSERIALSKALISLTGALLDQLDLANDAKRFCPQYASLSRSQKTQMWSELIVWMSYYESSWDPHSVYHEPPPLGIDSIGLLQLSYEDTQYKFCDLNRASKSLEDPIKNLSCGARIVAKWVSNDHAITTPSNKGAARYWSVLREGHKVNQIAQHVSALSICR